MKYCTNCGAKLNDEDRFCTVCGNKMPVLEPVAPAAPVAPVVEPAVTPVAPVVEPVVAPAVKPETDPVNEIPAEDMNVLNQALKMESGEAPSSAAAPVYAAPAPENVSANQQVFGAVDYGTKSAPQPQQYGYTAQQSENYGYGAQQYGYTAQQPQQYAAAPVADSNNKKPLVSMILGIAGLVCSGSGILGVGLGIPAIILSKSKETLVGKNRTFSKLGKIFGIVATICGAIVLAAVIVLIALNTITARDRSIDNGYAISVQEYKNLDELYTQMDRSLEDAIDELEYSWKEIADMTPEEMLKYRNKIQQFFDNTIASQKDFTTFVINSQRDGFKLIAKDVKKNKDWDEPMDELIDKVDDVFFGYLDEIDYVLEEYFDKVDDAFDYIEFDDYEALYDIYDKAWDDFYSIYESGYDKLYDEYSDVFDGFIDGETDVDQILKDAAKNR